MQHIAFMSEAELIGSMDIPALKQTYDGISEDFCRGMFLKVCTDGGRIIGSVRAFESNGSVEVGKLMVHPDYRRRGIAASLLLEVEKYFPDKRLELFTSTKSLCNITLYESVGYRQFKITHGGTLDFVHLEKYPK